MCRSRCLLSWYFSFYLLPFPHCVSACSFSPLLFFSHFFPSFLLSFSPPPVYITTSLPAVGWKKKSRKESARLALSGCVSSYSRSATQTLFHGLDRCSVDKQRPAEGYGQQHQLAPFVLIKRKQSILFLRKEVTRPLLREARSSNLFCHGHIV